MNIKIIAAQVALIQTTITAEKVELLAKANPSALALHDDKGNETFKAFVGAPSLSANGVTVNAKLDIVVIKEKPMTPDSFRKEYAHSLMQLAKLETQIDAKFAEFADAAAAIVITEVA